MEFDQSSVDKVYKVECIYVELHCEEDEGAVEGIRYCNQMHYNKY